jgi:guanylate kinase
MEKEMLKMIIVSAPSGAGKSTIVRHLLKVFPETAFSVSATSRPKREGEVNGREYYFITEDEFRYMIETNQLLEWQEVYPGSFYGTPRSEIMRMNKLGQVPVFDLDVVGGVNLKKMYGSQALSVFIKPPSYEVLEQRLRARATDTEQSLQKRLSKVRYELTFEDKFDKVIINDVLDNALAEAEHLIKSFLSL